MNVIQSIKAARRCGTPLIVIRTADPASTIEAVRVALEVKDAPPIIRWDIVRGALGVNELGAEALAATLAEAQLDPSTTTNPTEFIAFTAKLPERSVVFLMNIHRSLDDQGCMQAIWNARDQFKSTEKTLIGLCPGLTLPAELAQDVLILDEPLPTDAELKRIALDIYKSAQLEAPDAAEQERIVDATLGLAAFPAEQSMAMSITRNGMDMAELWTRKQNLIEQTPGLSVWRGREKFSDIGGCANVKGFLRDVLGGAESPRAIGFFDEIEKGIGTGADTSGVSQGMLGTLLTLMQDNSTTGCIFIGPPGAAKSAIAKATGNEGGIPTISVDMGAMKNSLVGESERRFRDAMKVIDAVSQKRALFIATCNSIGALPPELRRRFTFGTFYFELPDAAERKAIWAIYRQRYGVAISDPGVLNDEGWTGAEIKQCCDLSYRLRRTLEAAAAFIVPVAKSAAEQINKLREQADGKFISASHAGVYRMNRIPATAADVSKRVINFEGMN